LRSGAQNIEHGTRGTRSYVKDESSEEAVDKIDKRSISELYR
jgi:hypothetical protein